MASEHSSSVAMSYGVSVSQYRSLSYCNTLTYLIVLPQHVRINGLDKRVVFIQLCS